MRERNVLPRRVDARWFCLVETRGLVTLVEPNDQSADAKGTHTAALRVSLLYTRHIFGDVFDCDGVFDGETVALSL